MKRTRVAVVGCGHLGAIHARLLAAREDVELVAIVDPVAESRERAAAAHGCRPLAEPRDLVGLVDAAVVAAPTGLHTAVSLPLPVVLPGVAGNGRPWVLPLERFMAFRPDIEVGATRDGRTTVTPAMGKRTVGSSDFGMDTSALAPRATSMANSTSENCQRSTKKRTMLCIRLRACPQ
jgi:threonine dehydrogenase-like Zn-dependent dehydrogenase